MMLITKKKVNIITKEDKIDHQGEGDYDHQCEDDDDHQGEVYECYRSVGVADQ